MPPGPWSIPLLGVAYRIDQTAPHKTYTEWSKKYGDIMSLTLFGTQRVVVVSSEQTIREVLVYKNDYFSGKSLLISNTDGPKQFILGTSHYLWVGEWSQMTFYGNYFHRPLHMQKKKLRPPFNFFLMPPILISKYFQCPPPLSPLRKLAHC